MTVPRLGAALALLCTFACGPSTQTPGVTADAFDGPGDALSPPELAAFKTASDAVMNGGHMQDCMQRGFRVGVIDSEVVARMQFRKDGTITAIGFKANPPNDGVRDFLACVRAALAEMDLKNGPWEADRKVAYPFKTMRN